MNLDHLDDDIRDHIERETRDNIERGMEPAEARYAALRKFGNVSRVKEETRAVWKRAWLEQIYQDARYAMRTLRRDPMFATVIVATLAIALGLNTAVFSVIDSVLLKPIVYPHADRLVWLNEFDSHLQRDFTSLPDFAAWRKQARSFEAMAAFTPQQVAIQTSNRAVQMNGLEVAGDFWRIISPRPALGRVFGPDEQNVVVLSSNFFEREFAGDPRIIGKAVLVDERPFTVVGVLPSSFRFQLPAWWASSKMDGYFPVTANELARFRAGNVVAELKPSVRIEPALAEIEVIQRQVIQSSPMRPFSPTLYAQPLQEKLVSGVRRALIVLLAAGAFVLLIAAVNVANLLLARASARQREIAIRAAVGAGRMRIIRQLMVENLVLTFIGAAAGLLVARWAIAALIRISPDAVPRLAEATIDARVLAFTFVVAIATALLFGIGPALSLWRGDLHRRLKDGSRASDGFANLRFRRILVAAELALAIILLTGAGLMLKSFWRMNQHPAGFTPEQILTFKVRGPGSAKPYLAELIRRLDSIPGVRSAGISVWMLFSDGRFPNDDAPHIVRINASSPGYSRAIGMRLLKGRWLSESDRHAILMNESMAREAFGATDPLGQSVAIPERSTVVGIVADLKYGKLDASAPAEIYIPYSEFGGPVPSTNIAISTPNPAAIIPAIRKTIADLDPAQAAYDVKTLDQALAESIAPRRFNLFLLGIFASVALILAVIGVYGVIAYSVAERTREIGVRIALGAQTRGVVRMVVIEGMGVALAGILIGISAAFGFTRLMANLLYDVRPDDPLTFAAVGSLLALTALAACAGPALKAATIDPVIALRYE